MRTYPYRPDEKSLRIDLEDGVAAVSGVETTFAQGRGAPDLLGIAALDSWGAVAAGWALEESLDVPALLGRVAALLRERWRAADGPIASWDALGFVMTLAMVGDLPTLRAVADHVLRDDGLQADSGSVPSQLAFARVLAAMLAGRDGDAAAQPDPPGDDEQQNQLFTMARAVLSGDQTALDSAARVRADLRSRQAGRSTQNRRRWTFVLDRPGLGVMLAAQDRGLQPTPGVHDIPVEILALRVRG